MNLFSNPLAFQFFSDGLKTDTLRQGLPSFMGGGTAPMSSDALPMVQGSMAPRELPLAALYPPANVPMPLPVSELAASGGTDPYGAISRSFTPPRLGEQPGVASGPYDLLATGAPSPRLGEQPTQAPQSPYSLLDTGSAPRLGGDAAEAGPYAAMGDKFKKLGGTISKFSPKENEAPDPRMTLQAPQAGVGGRGNIDVTQYLRGPMGKRKMGRA